MGKLTNWISILLLSSSLSVGGGLPAYAATTSTAKQNSSTKSQVRKTVVRKSNAVKPKGTKQTSRKPAAKPTVRKATTTRKTKATATSPLTSYSNGDVGLRTGFVNLESDAVLVLDEKTGLPLLAKNETKPRPIASVTKLMTAMVVLDAKLPLTQKITIANADVDRLKYSSSRVSVGTTMTRGELLNLALMASENRAAHALGRTYPGGVPAFVKAMNKKAKALGMHSAKFVDPTGLSPRNTASPKDLAVMVSAAAKYSSIKMYSTESSKHIRIQRKVQAFGNTNPLVHSKAWDIHVSKTGYIREAGRCLVMHVDINNRPTMIVLLNGARNSSRVMDSQAIKRWLEQPDTKTALKAADILFSHEHVSMSAANSSEEPA